MPKALNQLIFLASLCNFGCKVYMGFIEAPVHCFLLDAYQVDNEIGAADEIPDALIIPSIEVLHLDYLQTQHSRVRSRLTVCIKAQQNTSCKTIQHARVAGETSIQDGGLMHWVLWLCCIQ